MSKYEVGRRRLIPRWPVRTSSLFHRIRVPGTKRSLLRFEGRYNPKTLQRELILKDKKPLFWMVGLFALAAIPIAVGQQLVFSIFGSSCQETTYFVRSRNQRFVDIDYWHRRSAILCKFGDSWCGCVCSYIPKHHLWNSLANNAYRWNIVWRPDGIHH